MELTAPRRSQLLQTLLQQQVQPQPNIRSGGELLAKLLAQGVRQSQINRMQEQEAASKKTEQANVAQVLSKLGGGPDMDFMGNPITDGSGTNMFGQPTLGREPQNNISMAQALGQLPVDNPVASAISGQMIQRAFATPRPDEYSTTQIREGDEYVTREVINGKPGRELARSPINPTGRPPSHRTRIDGNKNIFEEWNPETETWEQVSEGPRSSVQRVETGPPGSFETPANRDKETKRQENSDNLMGEMAIAMQRNRNNPGASGIPGYLQEVVEGTVGQVPIVGPIASDQMEELTKVNARELSKIRTQAALMVARLVPVVTGDDSGRYTDTEQKRTKEIESQLEAMKTSEQIDGALSEIQAITLRGEVRLRGADFIRHASGKNLDLSTKQGQNAWGNLLMKKYSLTEEDAFAELLRHMRMVK
tara:strand:+ start:313 stop:1575 length:1263 start_codon:yes stop_codon:yes gene_type:complete